MKVIIDENLKGKDLFKFLVENKNQLITQKRSMPIVSDTFHFKTEITSGKEGATKAGNGIADDATQMRVKVVANAALWCDSQMDVLLPDCWKRSIKERKDMIPHLHDHIHQVDAKIGEVAKIYSQDISLNELGLKQSGTTQVLIFETDVMKSYNEKVFNQYKLGKINQHSIGLQYVKIELAINDEENEKEFDFWNKYIKLVINREFAEERGFFWVVSEIKVLENSSVLFGSNELTPTLEAKNHPVPDTEEPSLVATDFFDFDLDRAIKEIKFFN